MPKHNSRKPGHRFKVLVFLNLFLLWGCGAQRRTEYVVLSYSERSTFCVGCPNFRVDLRSGGHVNLFGLSGCAIPGEYHFIVPEAAFSTLLRGFERARFFSIPRVDPRYGGEDSLVTRLVFRDEVRIHEVVDAGRPLQAISRLEKEFRDTTQVDKYLTPSVALYQALVESGWNVNTLGEDHQNALVPAVLASDSASVAFLLNHGAAVSHAALEFAVYSKTADIFRMLSASKNIDYRSTEGGTLLVSAAGAGNIPLIIELLDRGAPVNYRQPQNGDTALLVQAGNTDQTTAARVLIERGADVNARDWMGQTPLFRAATGTNTGMIELLTAHAADPNIRDKEGRTAIMAASSLCQYWNVKALLSHGADPLIHNNRGRSALEPDYVAPNDPKCSICRQLLKEAASDPGDPRILAKKKKSGSSPH